MGLESTQFRMTMHASLCKKAINLYFLEKENIYSLLKVTLGLQNGDIN